MRRLLAIALLAGLTACAGAPRKSTPPAAATPAKASAPVAGGDQARRKSPYAPAQEDPGKRGDYVAGGLYAPGVRDSVPDDIPDVDAIPEPEVTDEPRSPVGNRSTYAVLGKKYHVLDDPHGYVETGVASFYGKKFHGRRTSNLEVYDMYAFSAAHKTLPLPSFARVTNLDNGKSVIVRINDRGPFHAGRLIDLSYAAATKLGYVRQGTARVEVRALTADDVPALARTTPAAPAVDTAAPPPGPVPPPAPATAIDRLVAALPVAAAHAADSPGVPPLAGSERRFDTRGDGHTMSAAEFDAWLQTRRSHPPAAAAPATAVAAATPVADAGERVTLQVASFTARANADKALAVLRGAGIDAASLSDADAHGRKVWRLRVGPLSAAAAPETAARIAGLGFGMPQRIRE